ncbi:MAG: hypothetical protein ACYTDT_08235 [Planctomycetota bacterium]|jgi:hypothetical protein
MKDHSGSNSYAIIAALVVVPMMLFALLSPGDPKPALVGSLVAAGVYGLTYAFFRGIEDDKW